MVWAASEGEVREGEIMQKSDMIKLSFKRIALAAMWRINKRSMHGSRETSKGAAALVPQRTVSTLGQGGTQDAQRLDSRSGLKTE